MFLLLFVFILPFIELVEDDFLKFVLIIVWCVSVSLTVGIVAYFDRNGNE